MCAQESRNVSKRKLKSVMEEEEEEGYKSNDDSQGAYDSDNNPFCMKKYRIAEDTEIIEGKRLADAELEEDADSDEETDEDSDKEQLHYEGDTEVEELFDIEEDEEEDSEKEKEPPMKAAGKKRQKLPVRRGPTTRTHSNVLEDLKPDFRPSSDEEDTGLLLDSEDDQFEPLAFVLPKGRKSRAMKRPARIWYNEKLEQPHQQLCMHMCFKNQQQFRDALLSLHITQARNFRYHRNSDKRIIVCCKQEHCQFFIVAAVIKGEKTFAIKK